MTYAAEELKKYIEMLDPSVNAEITSDKCSDGIVFGLLSELGLDFSDVTDAMIDDVVDVKIDSLCGYIAGSNERSILFGVYDYLKSAGCRWVRPGVKGEYIPKVDYPFRGECSEGAVCYEHMRDTVYWLPKVNMNLFMIQWLVPYNFMSRWYTHAVNTVLPHDDIL